MGVAKMEIRKNEKLKKYEIELIKLKDYYSIEYNALTTYFWPIIAQNKKSLKNQIYYTGMMICLLVFITGIILLGGVKNEYLLWGSIAACVILITVGAIITRITLVKKKKIADEWAEGNQKVQTIQEEISEITAKAVGEIPYVICYSENYDDLMSGKLNEKSNEWQVLLEQEKQKMLEYTAGSLAYEDAMGYYNHWADNF